MKIEISNKIKELTPNFYVGGLVLNVKVLENEELNEEISNLENMIFSKYDISEIINIPVIKDGRNAYKKYGKDPSRYRLATESLFRRLSKGNKLYKINNIVDTGNVLSILTKKSIAVLDYNKIIGDVFIRLGNDEDIYNGIGRGKLNISNIPLYEDDISPFGSCTSDTDRTKITSETKKILVFIISFSGKENLEDEMNLASSLYSKYCEGLELSRFIE